MPLLYHAYVYLEFLILACTIYILAPCTAGRIPGAVKMATIWLIPKTAEKPIDGRTKRRKGDKHEKNTAG